MELRGEEQTAEELPYWETVNRYLEKLDNDSLQEAVCGLCRSLLRSRENVLQGIDFLPFRE